MKTIKEWSKEVHRNAVAHGWWEQSPLQCEGRVFPNDEIAMCVGAKLALIHSEVSEALECARVNPMGCFEHTNAHPGVKPEGFASELADVVIRVMDLAEMLGLDLESEIALKHLYNLTRPFRHGGKSL